MCGNFFFKLVVVFVGLNEVCSHELDLHPNWKYLPTHDCGYGASADRIVGGKEASLGQYPWITRIGYRMGPRIHYLCSGSLISKWYVISAVHCAVGVLSHAIHSVRIGDNYIKQQQDCEDGECAPPVQDIEIEKVIKYENYIGKRAISYGDIALIKLTKEAVFNDYASPICLPRGNIMDNLTEYISPDRTLIEVAGWGVTNSASGNIPDKLMYISIPVVELEVCRGKFKRNKIDESQICAGIGGGKDSCVGDSGGPLMNPIAQYSAPKYYLFGIVSYGMKRCGIGPAIYTSVPYYMKWILDRVEQ